MLVDSSVLIRTLQPHHSRFIPAEQSIRLLSQRGWQLHIVPQNLVDLWVVATRPAEQNGLGMSPSAVADEIGRLKSLFILLPETPAIYPAWEALMTRHKVIGRSAHDARLLAAMQVHALTAILTFDKTGFSRYPGIEVIRPDEVNA